MTTSAIAIAKIVNTLSIDLFIELVTHRMIARKCIVGFGIPNVIYYGSLRET